MKKPRPVHRLEWVVKDVVGFIPNAKTMRKWVNEGHNGVKLKTVAEGVFRSNTDEVVRFVFLANKRRAPAAAYDLDPMYLPRSAAVLFKEALGHEVSPSTITGWSKQGRRGVRLRTYSVGRFLLTTRADRDRFLEASGLKVQPQNSESNPSPTASQPSFLPSPPTLPTTADGA